MARRIVNQFPLDVANVAKVSVAFSKQAVDRGEWHHRVTLSSYDSVAWLSFVNQRNRKDRRHGNWRIFTILVNLAVFRDNDNCCFVPSRQERSEPVSSSHRLPRRSQPGHRATSFCWTTRKRCFWLDGCSNQDQRKQITLRQIRLEFLFPRSGHRLDHDHRIFGKILRGKPLNRFRRVRKPIPITIRHSVFIWRQSYRLPWLGCAQFKISHDRSLGGEAHTAHHEACGQGQHRPPNAPVAAARFEDGHSFYRFPHHWQQEPLVDPATWGVERKI